MLILYTRKLRLRELSTPVTKKPPEITPEPKYQWMAWLALPSTPGNIGNTELITSLQPHT
jgi:hypothetical protein